MVTRRMLVPIYAAVCSVIIGCGLQKTVEYETIPMHRDPKEVYICEAVRQTGYSSGIAVEYLASIQERRPARITFEEERVLDDVLDRLEDDCLEGH